MRACFCAAVSSSLSDDSSELEADSDESSSELVSLSSVVDSPASSEPRIGLADTFPLLPDVCAGETGRVDLGLCGWMDVLAATSTC